MTFYDFLLCHLKKRKKSCFLKSEKKRNIRILEHWLTLFPRPASRPSAKLHPTLNTSGFQLQPLELKQLRAAMLLLNQGPSEPCYATEWTN